MSTPSLTPDGQESFATQASFESTLTAVCEAAVKLVGVHHSGLVLFDHNCEYATVWAEYPSSAESAVGKRFQIVGVPLEEQLVHSRQPIVVQDVASEDSLGVVQKVLLDMGVGSIVVVPIIVDDEVKGSFSFDSINEVREFKDSDVEKCTSLAKFASSVVKNAYLVKNLEALRQAMLAIASEPERVPLLKAITREAVNLLQADGGGIDELDERKGDLTIVAQFNMPEEIVGQTMKVGEGLAGRIIKENLDSLTEPNYQEWEGKAPYFRNNTRLESLIGVPLRLNNKATGVLWLNAARPRVFSPAEVELLKGLAAPASIALEQTGLRDLERSKADRLQALAGATNDIFVNLATSTRQERLTLIAKYAHEIIDAELCGILLVEDSGWVTLVAGHGYKKGGFKEGLRIKITSGPGTGLTGHIAMTGSVFRVCGDELRHHPASTNRTGTADYSETGECFSVLAIPLRSQDGKLKGLISINNKNDKDGKPHQWTCFTDEDQAIGEIFAQAALVSIETADLLDEIKRGQDRYKTVLEASNVLALAKVPEDGLGGLAEMVLRVINRSFCRILFYLESEKSLQVIAAEKAVGKQGEFKWKQRLGKTTKVKEWKDLEHSLTSGESTVLRRGDVEAEATLDQLSELIELRDAQDNPLYVNYMLRTPLRVDKRIIGLMTIGELEEGADFSSFEIEYARAIANQASMLIERLEQDKKLLNALFETEREISALTDADKALRLIAAQGFEIGKAYGRKVNVVDINVRDGNKLRVVAAYPEKQVELIRKIVGDPFDLDTGLGEEHRLGIVGRAIIDGKAIIDSDVQTNAAYISIHDDTFSQLVVPIKVATETVGAISVESSEIGAFDKQDLLLFEGLAFQASSALSKEKQSREHKKMRTVALAGAAARFWRHGLRETATFMIGKIDKALSLSVSPEIGSALSEIRDSAKYIEEFRFIPLSSEEGVSDEALNDVIQKYLAGFQFDSRLKGVSLTVHSKLDETIGCQVRINRAWFQKALFILLENARDAIKDASSEKLIEVQTEMQKHSRCQIRIKNTGPKIDRKIWDKIGNEQIIRAGGNSERGGGILLADIILEVYGGKLERINNEENNIVIGMTLPVIPH